MAEVLYGPPYLVNYMAKCIRKAYYENPVHIREQDIKPPFSKPYIEEYHHARMVLISSSGDCPPSQEGNHLMLEAWRIKGNIYFKWCRFFDQVWGNEFQLPGAAAVDCMIIGDGGKVQTVVNPYPVLIAAFIPD